MEDDQPGPEVFRSLVHLLQQGLEVQLTDLQLQVRRAGLCHLAQVAGQVVQLVLQGCQPRICRVGLDGLQLLIQHTRLAQDVTVFLLA